MPECELPNGLRVECVTVAEAMFLWNEATGEGLYRSAAGTLKSGDTVIDVGANIGLVSLMFGLEVPDLRIIALEPAPVTFECLEANFARHLPKAVALQSAVSDRPGQHKFTFYPNSSCNSGLFADQRADDETTRIFMRNSGIAEEFIGDMVRNVHAGGVEMTVPTLTVSDLIRRYALAEVALLKVDVERAEQLVLAGVEDQHWPLVSQVVVEVHDEAGRLKTIGAHLEDRGFSIAVTQDPKLAGTDLYNVTARR